MHITPTFKGYLETEMDALLVLQACMDGKLDFVDRRPSDIERPYLIVPGNIFVFKETQSGIKRWTDGISWSPSRISGRFLIYKELNKRVPRLSMGSAAGPDMDLLDEKALLPVVYTGFVKKTFSMKMKVAVEDSEDGKVVETFHVVSYYVDSDVKNNVMVQPTKTTLADEVAISAGLMKTVESLPQGSGKQSGTTTHSSTCSSPSVTSNSSVASSAGGSPVTIDSSSVSHKRKSDGVGHADDKRSKNETRYLAQPLLPTTTSSGMFVPPPPLLPRLSSYQDFDSATPFHGSPEGDFIRLPRPRPRLGDEAKNNRVLLLPCYDSILTPPSNNYHTPSTYGIHDQSNYSTTERYSSTTGNNDLTTPKTTLPRQLYLPRHTPSLNNEKFTSQYYMQS